jgi:Tfp pilus assembly protein PilN
VPAKINLLPKRDLATTALGKVLKFSLTYGRYIIVITQLVVLGAFFSRFRLDRELTDLYDSVEQKRAIVEALSEFETEIRLIQAKLSQIKSFKQNQDAIRNSLESIKTILPPGNVLTNLGISQDEIVIQGTSEDNQTLAALIRQTGNSDKFSSVKFNQIHKDLDNDLINFSAVLKVKQEINESD